LPPRPRSVRADVSERLDAVIMRLVAKRPEDRFASADEVMRALELTSARGAAQRWTGAPATANAAAANTASSDAASSGAAPGSREPERVGYSSTLKRASSELVRDARAESARVRGRQHMMRTDALALDASMGIGAIVMTLI